MIIDEALALTHVSFDTWNLKQMLSSYNGLNLATMVVANNSTTSHKDRDWDSLDLLHQPVCNTPQCCSFDPCCYLACSSKVSIHVAPCF